MTSLDIGLTIAAVAVFCLLFSIGWFILRARGEQKMRPLWLLFAASGLPILVALLLTARGSLEATVFVLLSWGLLFGTAIARAFR
jgi:hypothetical protein